MKTGPGTSHTHTIDLSTITSAELDMLRVRLGITTPATARAAVDAGKAAEMVKLTRTPITSSGTSEFVTSVVALKAALANNAITDVVMKNGTYVIPSSGLLQPDSLWIGGGAISARTNPIVLRAETPGGVTFSGNGAGGWMAQIFTDGAHDQTWDGFRWGNGTPSETGVVVFGAYNFPNPPTRITLRRYTMLPTIGDSSALSNDNLIYFSHSPGAGPNNINIETYDADMAGGVDSAITFYHSEIGPNASDVNIRGATIRNHSGEGGAIQIWDSTVNRLLIEDVTLADNALSVQYQFGQNITLRRLTKTGLGIGFYSSGTGVVYPPSGTGVSGQVTFDSCAL